VATSSLVGSVGHEMLIGGALAAAAFNYNNIPSNIGADLDPAILKALQTAIGGIVGVSLEQVFFKKGSEFPAGQGLIDYWFGSHHSKTGRQFVLTAAATAGLAYLFFPDNRVLQAGAVFVVTVSKNINNWNF